MKYANKFETDTALEEGYKNLESTFTRTAQENADLKNKVAQWTPPTEYAIPQGITIDEKELPVWKDIAKEAGMTQAQFEKALQKTATISSSAKTAAEAAAATRKAERENKIAAYDKTELDSTTRFFNEKLPKPVADSFIEHLDNPEVFTKMKEIKQIMTSNQMPGLGTSTPAPITDPGLTITKLNEMYDNNEAAIKKAEARMDMQEKNNLMAGRVKLLQEISDMKKKAGGSENSLENLGNPR